jgi:hypothetical protein
MEDALEDRSVPARDVRHRFNEGDYWQRASAGEFRQVIARDGHPSQERSGEPYCTRSQIIGYWNSDGEMIAKVHQYLRPDGTIGGSGRPDPKVLFEHGVRYRALSEG